MAKKMCKLFMMLIKTFLIKFKIIEYTVFNISKNIFVSKVQSISFNAQNNVFILKHFQFSAGNKRENWEIASKECTLLLRFTSQNWASCKQMKKNFVLESVWKVRFGSDPSDLSRFRWLLKTVIQANILWTANSLKGKLKTNLWTLTMLRFCFSVSVFQRSLFCFRTLAKSSLSGLWLEIDPESHFEWLESLKL